MHREQDVVLKAKTAKEITKYYCFIIMEFIDVDVKSPLVRGTHDAL